VPGLDANDPGAVTDYANDESIDLVIIGPEAPLVAGVADALRERGIPVFGPGRAAAALEGSKAFAKRIMDAAGVPTGRAARAATRSEVETALDAYGAPYVVKADGLAAGKGVIVTDDRAAALAHADAFLGAGPVLVEEFLSGPEVSLFFVSDGDTVRALSPAQDFKRAYDGDAGPNTGGMGAYSPLPWLAERFGRARVRRSRHRRGGRARHPAAGCRGHPFIGLLYAGLILTGEGADTEIKVIEFNARFGDPETQVVLARLESPLSRLLMSAASGTLEDEPEPTFSPAPAITVVLASEGYPESPATGRPIEGLHAAASTPGVHLAHAATAGRMRPAATSSRRADACSTSSRRARASRRRASARTPRSVRSRSRAPLPPRHRRRASPSRPGAGSPESEDTNRLSTMDAEASESVACSNPRRPAPGPQPRTPAER
jgi:phosphoribosylamine--glycine ligase